MADSPVSSQTHRLDWKSRDKYPQLGGISLEEWLLANHQGRASSELRPEIEEIVGHSIRIASIWTRCHKLRLRCSDEAISRAQRAGQRRRVEREGRQVAAGARDVPAEREHILPIPWPKRPEAPGWEERIASAARVKSEREADDPFSFFARRAIPTDRPIGVLFTSDWQLGSLGVDYEQWQSDMDRFLAIPRLYMAVNGDVIDNIAVHRTLQAVMKAVMPPEQQQLLLAGLLQDLVERGKILSLTLSEEHDLRDERLTGFGAVLHLLRDAGVPLFANRGCLILRVGEWHYIIYNVHRSRYRSFLNQLHTGMREFQLGLPANVVVTSDTHRPAFGKYPWYPELRRLMEVLGEEIALPFTLGEEIYLIQTGTYEMESEYGTRFFGLLPRPKPLILVFHPDRFRIEVVEDFDTVEKLLG